MKNIIEIFQKDIKEVFRKTNTWIIIVGLIFLPSMYAWPNILSSWDPYGHTNNIKVAVTSEDDGATVDGKLVPMQVKVGDKVLYSKYSGTEVKVDGEEYIIVKESDILAIVE